MKNYTYLSIILAATMTSFNYGMQQDAAVCQTNGIQWKKDPFGNVVPNVQAASAEQLGENLPSFIAALRDKEQGNAFIVQLPHDQAHKTTHLLQAGFTPHHIDATRSEWVVKNGSPMPEASTAAAGARVLVCRGEDVLVIEDKNIKGRMMFPGGSVDAHELALDAACREIREEVDLTVNPADLQKIALVNRVSANRYGSSDYCHYYMTRAFTGTPKAQESEISQLFWYPLASLAKGEPTRNLRVSPTVKLLAAHIVSGGGTTSMRVLDPRQYAAASDKQNQADIMDIDLFAMSTQKRPNEQKNEKE